MSNEELNKGKWELGAVLGKEVSNEEYNALPEKYQQLLLNSDVTARKEVLRWYADNEAIDGGMRAWYALQFYCLMTDSSQDFVSMLKQEGYDGERMYRALPDFIRSKTGKVDTDILVWYLGMLFEVFGSTELRYDAP